MTALPPAGWYPDPEAAGRQWRWWDGASWAPPARGNAPAFDPVAYAHAVGEHARTTADTGRWLRWAMAGNAILAIGAYVGLAVVFHGISADWFSDTGTGQNVHISRAFAVVEVVGLGFQLVSVAFFILLIAWIYHAGKFAELQGWPAARGRLLGALSLLIPVVNLWWPYEAVRDAYPPGRCPPLVLHWWLSYLIVPFVSIFGVSIAALSGSVVAAAVVLVVAVPLAAVPVVLGWQLVGDVEATQAASLSR